MRTAMLDHLERRRLFSSISLANGIVSASASSGDDVISVSMAGDNLRVKIGSLTREYPKTVVMQLTLAALAGNDLISVAEDISIDIDVSITGGGGNDTLVPGGGGLTIIDANEGVDMIDFSSKTRGVNFGNEGTPNEFEFEQGGILKDVNCNDFEYINGSRFADVLRFTSSESVTILGNGGKDLIVGGDGDDVLSGGSQNDAIIGGGGADFIVGSAGRGDTVSYFGPFGIARGVSVTFDGVANRQFSPLTGVKKSPTGRSSWASHCSHAASRFL